MAVIPHDSKTPGIRHAELVMGHLRAEVMAAEALDEGLGMSEDGAITCSIWVP